MAKPGSRMLVSALCLAAFCCPLAISQQPDVPDEGGMLPPLRRRPRPLVVESPPGEFASALVSPAYYISPFASLFAIDSGPSSSGELRDYYQSASRFRLLNVPEMFGDFRRGGPVVVVTPTTGTLPGLQTEIPIAAAISGLRAAENNHALPSDRVWFAYNYFDGAFDVATDDSFGLDPQSSSQSLHRSVIAIEKLLDCGRTSLEVRMPFGSAFAADGIAGFGGGTEPFRVEGESLGNLNLLLKRLLYADEVLAWSAGLGLEVPTGSPGEIIYDDLTVVLEPEAVHFAPFIALTQGRGRWFGHCFLQLDVASHGDPLRATLDVPGSLDFAGRIDQPVLLGVDLGGGFWLVPPRECGRGLAAVGEVHYTTPLGSEDEFLAAGALTSIGVNTPAAPSYEVLHFTAGLQLSLEDGWRVRGGVVVPALSERVFDAEYLLQINRSF